tara:strand:+ start:38 stop:337 length:300 start_codon:yes stop_codon:yes gene_type:complete
MLPESWDDLFYLMKKEVHKHPELPNFTIEQLKKIHKLFWANLKKAMRDETSEISLSGFMRIVPKLNKIKRNEERKQNLDNGYGEQLTKSREANEDSTER